MNNRNYLNQTNIDTVINILSKPNFINKNSLEPKYQNYLFSSTNFNLAFETIENFNLKIKKFINYEQTFLSIIKEIILNSNQYFLKSILKGPHHLMQQLTENEVQCFHNAGLLVENPSMEIIQWWDSIKEIVRDRENIKKVEIGREAEKLSFQYEKEKLSKYNLEHLVKWVSPYDDLLGYDIESVDKDGEEIFIEVKKSSIKEMRFFFTRNEWRKAQGKKSRYLIHFWDQKNELKILNYKEISKLVLKNNDNTEWVSLEIKI